MHGEGELHLRFAHREIAWKLGRYMSMDSDPNADSAPRMRASLLTGPARPGHQASQNIPLELAAFSGMGWTTSQCSTILPFSSLKMSMMALPRVPGSRMAWTWRMT